MTYHEESNGISFTVLVTDHEDAQYDVIIHNASDATLCNARVKFNGQVVHSLPPLQPGDTSNFQISSNDSESVNTPVISLYKAGESILSLYPSNEPIATGKLVISLKDKNLQLEKDGHHTLTLSVQNTGTAPVTNIIASLSPVSDQDTTQWQANFTKYGNRKLKNKDQTPTVSLEKLDAGEHAVWTIAFDNGRLPQPPKTFTLTATVCGQTGGRSILQSNEVQYLLEEKVDDPFAILIYKTFSIGHLLVALGSLSAFILLLALIRFVMIRHHRLSR